MTAPGLKLDVVKDTTDIGLPKHGITSTSNVRLPEEQTCGAHNRSIEPQKLKMLHPGAGARFLKVCRGG